MRKNNVLSNNFLKPNHDFIFGISTAVNHNLYIFDKICTVWKLYLKKQNFLGHMFFTAKYVKNDFLFLDYFLRKS